MKPALIGIVGQPVKWSSCKATIPVLCRKYLRRVLTQLPLWLLMVGLFTGLISVCLPAQAQEAKGMVTGHATDKNHDPLAGARVELQPLGQTVVTDNEGAFKFSEVAPGSYTVNISYVGFTAFSNAVTVAAGGTTDVAAELKIATVTEEVMVKGERVFAEVEALNRQETADNIVQVLASEVITSLPNTNIADAVGRLPNVSLERDEGEGKYVQIRGTEPRLSNVTIDGVHVPSPEAVRNVKLDCIPADLIDSVEINKTLSADQEADAIGGSVNLVTKKATEQPYVTVLGLGGYTPIAGGRRLDTFTGTVGQRFGRDKRFGVMFGGSYDWNGRGYNDIEPSPGLTSVANGDFANGVPVFYGYDLRDYQFDRTRFGFATSLDYKLARGPLLYLRGLFSQFNDNGQYWVYAPSPGPYISATTTAPTGSMSARDSNRNTWQQILNLTAGAQHTFGNNFIAFEVSGGQAHSKGGYPKGVFDGPSNIAFGLDNSNPHTPKLLPLNGVNIYDPTTYTLNNVRQLNTPSSERDFTGSIRLTHHYSIGTHFGEIEGGFKVRDAQKDQSDSEAYYYYTGDQAPPTMSQFLGTFTDPNYYMGVYKYGPMAEWKKVNGFFNANRGLFTLDVNNFHALSDANDFTVSERVYAGYVMNTITLGRVRLQGGLRFEETQGSFVGTQANFTDGNFVSDSPVPGKQSYLDVLPSIQLQYSLGSNMAIRAAYGRGISRPNFGSLPPFFAVDNGATVQTVNEGNPNLVATHANNYDVMFERYLKSVGVIQAGWFYKALTDPIYTVTTIPTTGQYTGYHVTQPINGPSAHIQGIEMAWRQHLNFLPGLLGGMGVSANYSYTTSQASFPNGAGRTDHPTVLRTAPNNWNFDTTYDKGPISARLGLTHNDANLWTYNYQDGAAGGIKGPYGDIYLFPHTQVDVQVMYHIPHMHDFQAVVSVLNLTNEVFGFYQGSEQYPIQREYYNRTYSFGLRWTPTFGKK